MTEDELQALSNLKMEENQAMEKLTRIDLKLSQIPTKSQEETLVLSNQL